MIEAGGLPGFVGLGPFDRLAELLVVFLKLGDDALEACNKALLAVAGHLGVHAVSLSSGEIEDVSG